jgi:LPS-assembly lipoprotein
MAALSKRAALLALLAGLPLLLAGCGWRPLYADPETGPAAADLRAVRVEPIAERIGQRLETALRASLNPTGESTPSRYALRTTLAVYRQDLGLQSQGLSTRSKLDVYATIVLSNPATGEQLLNRTIHAANSFDIVPNEYATVVAEDDARSRTVAELDREIVTELTLFLQRRAAAGAKPAPHS